MSQETPPPTPDPAEGNQPAEGPSAINEPVQTSPAGTKLTYSTKIFIVCFYAAIGIAVAWYAGAREQLVNYWYVVAGVLALALATAIMPIVRRWVLHGQAQRGIGAIIVGSITLIVAFFCVVFLVEPDYQAAVLRLVFITVVCSLPAVMYYLFIATKKYSLLNELTINLRRLGLLEPSHVTPALRQTGLDGEGEAERENRIKTYVQKFGSVYGSIPTDLGGFLLKPSDPSKSAIDQRMSNSPSGFTNIFTFDTVLPILLATLLIALGWLITLPPWEGRFEFGKLSRTTPGASIETQSVRAAAAAAPSSTSAGAANAAADSVEQPSDGAGQRESTSGEERQKMAATDKWLAVFSPVRSSVRFAFIGAYFFALQLLFRRYVRRDLRASAYVAVSNRIILAMLGVWVLGAALEMMPSAWVGAKNEERFANTLLVGAFVVGVFPRVVWQVVQAALKKRLGGVVAPNMESQLPISDLDGLTVWHEARFEEEDIENIPNMATADIVDMMINTRFPPDRIIDWVDQAILYTHLGHEGGAGKTRRELLRAHGVRTASALVEAYNRSAAHGDRDLFEEILPGEGRRPMRTLVDAVGTNPNLKLIQTWRGLLPHTHGDEGDAPQTERGDKRQEGGEPREERRGRHAPESPATSGGIPEGSFAAPMTGQPQHSNGG